MLLLIGFLFELLIFAAVGLLSGALPFFIDAPSAAIIIVSLAFFLIASKSGRTLGAYMKTSFKKGPAYTRAELEGIRAAVKNTVKFTLATGAFAFLAGLVVCLGYLGAMEKLGPNLAISILTLLYSITTAYFVFFPLGAWAENKLAATQNGM